MPKREHWSTRLKRENKELKAKNAELKQENADLKQSAQGTSDAPATPAEYVTLNDTGKDVEPIERVDRNDDRNVYEKVFITRRGKDSNWIIPHEYFAIEGSNRAYQIAEHQGDEVDIFVFDDNDRRNVLLSGGDELQGGWSAMRQDIKTYWLNDVLQGVPIRTIFDRHGFFDQFPEVQAQEFIREKLYLVGSDQVIEPPEPPPSVDGYWQIRFPYLDQISVNGEGFAEYFSTTDVREKTRLWRAIRNSIRVDYVNGRQHADPLYHFQLVGDGSDWVLGISIVADPNQDITISFGDITPMGRVGNYLEYEGDGIYGNRSADGKVRFE